MENVKEVLKLSVEQKGAPVPTGELTVYLDGLTVTDQEELAPLTNGNAANGTSELSIYVMQTYTCTQEILAHDNLIVVQSSTCQFFLINLLNMHLHIISVGQRCFLQSFPEVQQNGDAIHENGDSSSSSSRAANR